jgi:hypothetical protein
MLTFSGVGGIFLIILHLLILAVAEMKVSMVFVAPVSVFVGFDDRFVASFQLLS